MSPPYSELCLAPTSSLSATTSGADGARPGFREAATGVAVLLLVWLGGYYVPNFVNMQRDSMPAWYTAWDRLIPYSVWMIIPYVSMNVLYLTAPLACRTRRELYVTVRRIAVAGLIAALIFLALPTKIHIPRPEQTGAIQQSLQALLYADLPNNAFPSLHIVHTLVLSVVYMRPFVGAVRWAIGGWFGLIAVSTLMTGQHYLLDAAAGGLLGWACCRWIPLGESSAAEEEGPILLPFEPHRAARARRRRIETYTAARAVNGEHRSRAA